MDFLFTKNFLKKMSEYKVIEYNFPINDFKTYMKKYRTMPKNKKIYCFKDLENM